MIRVYIAGALNAIAADYVKNIHKMIEVAEIVRREGVGVYIPCLDFLCGVVHGDWTYEQYFSMNQPWLEVSDALFLVPGWEESEGTKKEIEHAKKLGIAILKTLEDLIQFIERKGNETDTGEHAGLFEVK